MKNRTRVKRISIAICLLLAAAMLLTACGGSPNTGNGTSEQTTRQPADTSETGSGWVPPEEYGIKLDNLNVDGTLKGQYAGQKITLITSGGDFEPAVKEASGIFEQLSGAKVEIQAFPWEELTQKIQLGLNSGGQFDNIIMPVAFNRGYQEAGLLADLDELMSKYGAPGYDINDFIPAVLDAYGKDNGKLFAIPYKADVFVLFYRKDLLEDPAQQQKFKEKTGKDLKVPETPDEMKQVAEFFTKSLNPESPIDYGFCTQGLKGSSRWMWTSRLGYYGGNLFDADMKPGFNNDAGVKSMQFALDLMKYAPKEFMQIGYDELNLLFTDGDVFMAEQWPGLYLATQAEGSKVKGKVGYAVTPGQKPTTGGWSASIAKNAQNPEVAWKFTEFMTSKDGEIIKIKNTMDPCRTSNYEREGIKNLSEMYPALLKSLQSGTVLADPPVPYISAKLNDIYEKWTQDAYSGKIGAQEAIKSMSADVENEMKQAGLTK